MVLGSNPNFATMQSFPIWPPDSMLRTRRTKGAVICNECNFAQLVAHNQPYFACTFNQLPSQAGQTPTRLCNNRSLVWVWVEFHQEIPRNAKTSCLFSVSRVGYYLTWHDTVGQIYHDKWSGWSRFCSAWAAAMVIVAWFTLKQSLQMHTMA